MTTPAGHTRAILASRVKGTSIYGPGGAVVGHVEDIVLDKMSNEILFAVIGFGGMAGMGEKYHPVPWSSLDYDKQTGGYVVGFGPDFLENAPTYQLDELTEEDGKFIQKATEYYHRPH
jgi:sporulation protein YlmC with PRC-barrel domain